MGKLISGFSGGPVCFARGMNGDLYGVNGARRGFRWDGVSGSADLLGIYPPSTTTVVAINGTATYYVSGVDVVDSGNGYSIAPTVTFSGGGGTAAACRSVVVRGRMTACRMQSYGKSYTTPPTATVGEPSAILTRGSSAAVTAVMSGYVFEIVMVNRGSGYTSVPTVTISAPTGANPVNATGRAVVNSITDTVDFIIIDEAGSGYTSAPTVTIGGPGSSASATAKVLFSVASLTISAGGTGYSGNPAVTFSAVPNAGGAQAEMTTSGGVCTGSTIIRSGSGYTSVPTATVQTSPLDTPTKAILSPVMVPEFVGKYWMAMRYVQQLSEVGEDGENLAIASSITELVAIELTTPNSGFTWTWSPSAVDARATHVELWRSSADQAIVLYRIARRPLADATYTDTVGEAELINPKRTGFKVLPILLSNGAINARRFTPPPETVAVMVMFQERMWYAKDSAAKRANYIMFSEAGEPESVPHTNELRIQENVRGEDQIVALMPFGAALVVFQQRHCHRLAYVSQPIIDASIVLIGQRGILSQRCWDTAEGVAYVVDHYGMYTLEASTITPISDVVDDYWDGTETGQIDFSGTADMFVRCDPVTKVVRFFFKPIGTSATQDRALCYHSLTKAWWEERYAQKILSGGLAVIGQRPRLLLGGEQGTVLASDSGYQDHSATDALVNIACTVQTGNMGIDQTPARNVTARYKPTTTTSNLTVGLHFNNSSTARLPAAYEDDGSGFIFDPTSGATLDMNATRSPLGDSVGQATARFAGRSDARSAGTDRHLAVALSATVSAATNAVVLNGLAIEGVA